jgi:signal transduction histidine kinase
MASIRRTVLEPLDQLTQHALAVGERADLTARLDMRRDDELGTLAREFDGMVGRLAEARRELLEQSYRSGIAETASGVLHNIGNAITPLKVNVAHLLEKFRAAPAQDLEQALAELGQPGTPPERRALLGQFVDLAGRELAATVRAAPEDLRGISRQVEHVQQIVADQERFSRAARVLEPLSLAELLEDSVAVLGTDLRRDLAVKIDPGVAALGRVCASRAALQQVVVNLIVNAAEAVRASGREAGTGVLAVTGAVEEVEGNPCVHLRFSDNGAGIPAENVTRVFDRGFTTKNRKSSGLGLHWSSVTVGSMGGRLLAESEGAGRGACLHLLLPLARSDSAAAAAAA